MSTPWTADPHYGQYLDPPHPLNEKRQMAEEAMAEDVMTAMNDIEAAEERLITAIETAREAGVSWATIAPWIGKNSRQSAQKWFEQRRPR